MKIEQLEAAIERAEKPVYDCMTTTITLMECYRVGIRGFTDSEIEYWTVRLNRHCDSLLVVAGGVE